MLEWSHFQTRKRERRLRCRWQNPVFSMNDRAAPLAPGPEQNKCADDRHDESSRMKRRAGCRSREEPPDQSADDGSADAKNRRHAKPQALVSRQDRARARAQKETVNAR